MVEQFIYLGTTITNQNSIQEEIKGRLKSGNACYHSEQNILSSSLLSKNLKIKIYRTVTLPVVLYGCETWSVTLMEESRLRVFENRVLREIKKGKVTGEWRKICNEELNGPYCSPNIVWVIKPRRMRWTGHVARVGRGEVHTGWWLGNLRERDHLEDSGLDGTIMLRWIFRKWDVGVWIGLNWLRIGQVAGTCECGNGPSVFIKCGKLLTSRKLVSFSKGLCLSK